MKKATLIFCALMVGLVVYVATGADDTVTSHATPKLVEQINTAFEDGAYDRTITSLNVTNGQEVTVASGWYVLNGIGGADDSTNTITLANATAGQKVILIVNSASTNLITIADSGIMALSSAWLGDNNDNITLFGVSTNWVEIGQVDN